jgi:phage/plasmid primase-like uncharacterized protein
MGARGPKPGFKKAREAAAAQAVEVSAPSFMPTTHADRENPDKISGDDLKALAHRRGIAKSLLSSMTDEKIRTELRYITHRQYDDAVA